MEAKLQKELKALASSSRSNAAMKLAARNVVDARKSKERMLATKARLNSVSMSLASQVRARRGGETCDGWEGNFFFLGGGIKNQLQTFYSFQFLAATCSLRNSRNQSGRVLQGDKMHVRHWSHFEVCE